MPSIESLTWKRTASLAWALCAAFVFAVRTPAEERKVLVTFAAFGDVPYSAAEEVVLRKQIETLPIDAEFVLHVGDIKTSTTPCEDGLYSRIAEMMARSKRQIFIVVGDNEWNDCPDPNAAWELWKKHYLHYDKRWKSQFSVVRQEKRTENFAFVRKGVLFLGLNIVGGRVNSRVEWNRALLEALEFTRGQVKLHHASLRRVVIQAHANPNANHRLYFDGLSELAEEVDVPYLYLHGDGHRWIQNRPFPAQNILRVQVDQGGIAEPLLVSVTEDDAEPFVFERSPSSSIFRTRERSSDARHSRDLSKKGLLPFRPAGTQGEIEARARSLRLRTQVALGLWPMPKRGAVEAEVFGRVERDEYSVEGVRFESLPGQYVTGSLYRPKPASLAKRPAVLSPYGHWPGGRFHRTADKKTKAEIESGRESIDVAAQHPLQARNVQLARMGCVVFQYDMVGYGDSQQLPHEAKRRPGLDAGPPVFRSPGAYRELQSVAGLQTFHSIRALDFLESLPDVDPARIAVTGASGGGMQTHLLCAIDSRPIASAPIVSVFVSRWGAPCTMAPHLRFDHGTIATAALVAPRALCVVNAGGDWTSEFETEGRPQLASLYRTLGVADRFVGRTIVENPHNYNALTRRIVFEFLRKHLKLDPATSVDERTFVPLTKDESSVWSAERPAPSGDAVGVAHERSLLRAWRRDSAAQIRAAQPRDAESLNAFRRLVGSAFAVLLSGERLSGRLQVLEWQARTSTAAFGSRRQTGLLRDASGVELPVVRLDPEGETEHVVLWLHSLGKRGIFDPAGWPIAEANRLLQAGSTILTVDLFGQGELGNRRPRLLENDEHYTLSNRRSVYAEQVNDATRVAAWAHATFGKKVRLLAPAGVGHVAAGVRWVARDIIARTALDTARFRFGSLQNALDPNFLAGAAKYGDLPALLALSPSPLWVAGEPRGGLLRDAFNAAGVASPRFRVFGRLGRPSALVLSWILE